MMEHVRSLDRCWPFLFTSEDEIDPFVQVCRHVVTFQGLIERLTGSVHRTARY